MIELPPIKEICSPLLTTLADFFDFCGACSGCCPCMECVEFVLPFDLCSTSLILLNDLIFDVCPALGIF